jgi:hypothetical protein
LSGNTFEFSACYRSDLDECWFNLEGRSFTRAYLLKAVIYASGGYGVGLAATWETWELWKVIEMVEMVNEVQEEVNGRQ